MTNRYPEALQAHAVNEGEATVKSDEAIFCGLQTSCSLVLSRKFRKKAGPPAMQLESRTQEQALIRLLLSQDVALARQPKACAT
jgi:hypothetical protein